MIARKIAPIFLGIVLLQSGCTGGMQAIRAPKLDERLAGVQPIRLVTPLATVYYQFPGDFEPTMPANKSTTLGSRVYEELTRQVKDKGWATAPPIVMEWRDIAAGTELSDKLTSTDEPQSQATLRIMRQLDKIGRHLRLHDRLEGKSESDQRVDAADTTVLAKNGSLLFAMAIGCDGRITQGPCYDIQSPPLQDDIPGRGFFRTVPAGLALHLFWVDAASGQLLWYDTTRNFNAEPGYAKNITSIIAETLTEFPSRP